MGGACANCLADLTNNKVDEAGARISLESRPFLYDPEHVDPQAVAFADKQTFIVEAVRRYEYGPHSRQAYAPP